MLFFPCLLSLGIVQASLTLLSLTRSLEIPRFIHVFWVAVNGDFCVKKPSNEALSASALPENPLLHNEY